MARADSYHTRAVLQSGSRTRLPHRLLSQMVDGPESKRIGLGDGETALRNGGLDNVQRASANTDPVRDAPFARSPSALAWLHTYVFAGQTTTRRNVQLARHLLRVQGRPRPPRIHTSLHSPRLEADRGLLDLIVAEILPMRTSKSRASGRAAGGAQQQRVRATKSENPP